MGRNDPCFCGSGKKTKSCHPDISEQSIAARVLALYHTIDNQIKEHYKNTGFKAPCTKGCTNCCYTDFPLSGIEFDLIIYGVRKWDQAKKAALVKSAQKQWDEICNKYPDYVHLLETNASGHKDIFLKTLEYDPDQQDFRCLFLDETNSCMIYPVRPITCRVHGEAFYSSITDGDICDIVGNSSSSRKWQADLTNMFEEIQSLSLLKIPQSFYSVALRTYPMFYYIYKRALLFSNTTLPYIMELEFNTSEKNYIQYMTRNHFNKYK